MSAAQTLAIVLALSIAGNAVLGWMWIGAREDVAVSTSVLGIVRDSAQMCSEGAEQMIDEAGKLAVKAKAAQAAARQAATQKQALAQIIMSTPAAVPGDDCASARVRVDGWLMRKAAQ
jgi:hypothetical protein